MYMCNYKNKVAVVQSERIYEKDTRIEYLKIKNSQLLTSNNEKRIFRFIKKHACENEIYNFVLHIDSGTLSNLILLMDEKKIKSKKTRNLLAKCIFVATYSNADDIRVLNKEKDTGIHFALSPLSELLTTVPNGSPVKSEDNGEQEGGDQEEEQKQEEKEVMVVVSDNVTPYYTQTYDNFVSEGTTLVKYKVSELTVDMFNDFANVGGYVLVMALDTEEEFNNVGGMVADSEYTKQVHIIECTQPASEGVRKMQSKVSDIQTSSSGVCINGTEYPGLNTLIAYEKCAAVLTQLWHCWPKLKEARIFSE